MQVRIQPRNPVEALQGLTELFEAASAAATRLRDQQQQLCSAAEQLASAWRDGGAALLQDLAEAAQGARRSAAEMAGENPAMGARLATLQRAKDESLTTLAERGRGLVEVADAALANANRRLAELEQKLDGVRLLGARRRREVGQHLQGTAEFFHQFERGQRIFESGLGRLKSHFAEQAEHRGQREFARNRVRAVRATEAGLRALEAGGLAEAEGHFRDAYDRCPSPESLFGLVLALVRAGKHEESQRLLSAAALRQCDPVEVQALKALKALLVRDGALALREAEAGLHICPDHPGLRRLAATAALATDATATAVRYLSPSEAATLRVGVAELPRP